MKEHPMEDNDQYRLVGIKFDMIRGNQYKRIVSDYSKQYKLLASEYFGKEFNWDAAKGREVLQDMIEDVFPEASTSWMNKIFVLGGPSGYLTGRLFKQTREFQAEVTDFEVQAEHLPPDSFVIIDTDLNERMLKASMTKPKSPPIPPRVPKRGAVNDTLFESAEPDERKQRTDQVAVTDIEWKQFGDLFRGIDVSDPKSIDLIKRMIDHYGHVFEEERTQFAVKEQLWQRKTEDWRIAEAERRLAIGESEQRSLAEIQRKDEQISQQSNLLRQRELEILELKQQSQGYQNQIDNAAQELRQMMSLREALNNALGNVRIKDEEIINLRVKLQSLESQLIQSQAGSSPAQKMEFSVTNPFSPNYKPKLPVPNLGSPILAQQALSRKAAAQPSVGGYIEDISSITDEGEMMGEPRKRAHPSAPRLCPVDNRPTATVSAGNKLVSIAKYGIRCWQEDECSLIEHLGAVALGLDVAREAGVTEKTLLMSLVFQSLPQKHSWAREFIDPSKEPEDAMVELVEVLVGDTSQLLSDFMKVQKKREEPLLQYFCKLRRTYAYASSKKMSDLEADQVACKLVVQKLRQCLEPNLAAEFSRRIESDAAANTLSMKKLSNVLLRVSHLMPETTWSTGEPTVAALRYGTKKVKCTKCDKVGHTAAQCWRDEICKYCKKQGHIAEFCRKRVQSEAMGSGSREPKTDGILDISAIDFGRIKCHKCQRQGHIARFCPENTGSKVSQ